ncbi:MAG: hypothetical protein AAGC60_23275 [Acidobacteriota bacterium]
MGDENRRRFEKQVQEELQRSIDARRAEPAGGGFGIAAESTVTSLENARDKTRDPIPRVAALHALASGRRNDDEFVQTLLDLVTDQAEPAELRSGVLRIIGQLRFSSVTLNARRPELIDALRSLIDAPDLAVRRDAVEMLSQEKDEYAQRRLLDSLDSGEPLAGSLEKTIQLLGYDIHADYYPLLRDIARTADTPEARREAVRLLAADAQSVDVLQEILRNRDEDQQVRRASASGYLSLDPQGFERDAREIVFDESEDDEVRAATLSALTHFAHPSARDAELHDYVDELERSPGSESLNEAARAYQRQRGRD